MARAVVVVAVLVLASLALVVVAVDRSNFRTCAQTGFCRRTRAMVTASGDGARSHFYLDAASLQQTNASRISATLRNERAPHVRLALELRCYDEFARVRVTEPQAAPRGRYEVRDVVVDTLAEAPCSLLTGALAAAAAGGSDVLPDAAAAADGVDAVVRIGVAPDGSASSSSSSVRRELRVRARPFALELLVDGRSVIKVNSRNLFQFEHHRRRDNNDNDNNNNDDASGSESGDDDEGDDDDDDADADADADNHDESANDDDAGGIDRGEWEESFKNHPDSKPYGPTAVAADFVFPDADNVYGIPEHADSFTLRATRAGETTLLDPYRLYNLDVFEYELQETMALYGHVPFVVAHHAHATAGVLWLNAAETWVDVDYLHKNRMLNMFSATAVSTHWISESGIVDAWLFSAPAGAPHAVLRQYARVTGTQQLPPLWSLGYHQCKWNYKTINEVYEVNDGFETHNLPMDTLWLDIEHTDGKRYFTWDATHFAQPAEMIDRIADYGRHMVTIIDPHIKNVDTYPVCRDAKARNLLVKEKDGTSDFKGWCWPGDSVYLDFTNPDTRRYWAEQFAYDRYVGSRPTLHTWNDMNEPSVFNGPEISMKKDLRHHDGWEHRDVHNQYGQFVHSASMDGLVARDGAAANERPFVLSRAFFAGSQRYGAIWTGDNIADWSHLRIAQPMMMSLAIGGIHFSGADVGGFMKHPDGELITRWLQAAIWQPFLRNHAHLDAPRREPWRFGDEWLEHARRALRTRYSYLPYLYTLFAYSHISGVPPLRPLWLQYPRDTATFSLEDQFMLGSALVVAPVYAPAQSSVPVYLPAGRWYDHETHAVYTGPVQLEHAVTMAAIPVFARGGSIVPRKMRPRRSTAQMTADPYTLYVYLDAALEARGQLYVDDGHTFDYERLGALAQIEFAFAQRALTATPRISDRFELANVVERVVIVGAPAAWRVANDQFDSDYDAARATLTVRNPRVRLDASWQIEFVQ